MMNDSKWIEEARGIAARCWCDETTKHLIMEPALAEVFAQAISSWMETAATYSKNADYWRGKAEQSETPIAPEPAASPTTTAKSGAEIRSAYAAIALAAAEYAKAIFAHSIATDNAGKALADYTDSSKAAGEASDKYESALAVFDRANRHELFNRI